LNPGMFSSKTLVNYSFKVEISLLNNVNLTDCFISTLSVMYLTL